MKTFTETERREIEQRVQAATGMPFEGCRPECLLTETRGIVETFLFQDDKNDWPKFCAFFLPGPKFPKPINTSIAVWGLN